jgi:hypothetical protein
LVLNPRRLLLKNHNHQKRSKKRKLRLEDMEMSEKISRQKEMGNNRIRKKNMKNPGSRMQKGKKSLPTTTPKHIFNMSTPMEPVLMLI